MQLKDLDIEFRKSAVTLKADFVCDDPYMAFLSNDYDTNYQGLNALLKVEPEFFLVTPELLDMAFYLAFYINDDIALQELESLGSLSLEEKRKRKDNYLIQECLRYGYIFDYEEYQEILEISDYLLREVNKDFIYDSPYFLFAVNYVSCNFDDYYKENIEANNYINDLLVSLTNDDSLYQDSLWAVYDAIMSFNEKQNAKIVTFKK